jgi:hypothetical protein
MRSVPLKASFANRSIARILVTLTLASSLLSSVVPFSTASSTKQCAMACCAGKAPHVAGSCVHESCESPPLQAQVVEAKEHLCGEEAVSNARPVARRKLNRGATRVPAKSQPKFQGFRPVNAMASLKKPCPPDCGTALCSSANQWRQRESLALLTSELPQPTPRRSLNAQDIVSQSLDVFCRNCPARAPPVSLPDSQLA